MLFDPLEEQFDLPSAFVQSTDCQGWELKMIGQKDQRLARFRMFETDTAKVLRVPLTGKRSAQRNGLIAGDSRASVGDGRVHASGVGILLGSHHEDRTSLRQPIVTLVVQVCSL